MICVHVTIVKKKKKNLNPLVKPKLHKLVSDKEWEKEFKLQREKIFVDLMDNVCWTISKPFPYQASQTFNYTGTLKLTRKDKYSMESNFIFFSN